MAGSPACYHCGLPADTPQRFTLQHGRETLLFCCPGCRAVAQTILDSGLGNYYDYRSENASQAEQSSELLDFSLYDRDEFQHDFVSVTETGHKTAVINIQGITCAACTWLIEQRLGKVEGVDSVHVNLAKHRASVSWNPEALQLSGIFDTIETIGYNPSPYSADREEQLLEAEQRLALRRLGVAGIGMMQVGMYAIALHAGALQGIADHYRDFIRIFSLVVATAVVFYSARPFFEAAWRSIKNRSLGMDVPVSLAIGLAYSASCWATFSGGSDVYFDSVAMFTFFLLGSRFLEMRARQRNHLLSQGLAALKPRYAWRVPGEDQQAVQIPIGEINSGDTILVKPGEVLPADGVITRGDSSVDESAFSGEYLPVPKTPGDSVTAGSINADGLLTVRVTEIAENTRLALITRLLEKAQQHKPHAAQLADRVASGFVATVLICAAVAAVYWILHDPDRALWVALSVLVVSCPCALSLATPTALTAALATLKSRGVLLSRSTMLEQLPAATLFAFDKTGTLTSGQLQLQQTTVLADVPEQQCIAIASALERFSNHPVASAFGDYSNELPVYAPEVVSGQGICGTIEQTRYRIGSWQFAGAPLAQPQPVLATGDSPIVYLSRDQKLLAAFILDDPIRPSAAVTLAALRERGFATVILSGDSSAAVPAVARATGVTEFYSGMNAQQKLEKIQHWQQQGQQVVMVGDGINDVPVLAAADMSVAMVNASELAKASADCLLLSGDLKRLLTTLDVAVKTRSIIVQNLGWALLYNTFAIPLAAAGLIAPWLAAIGMSSSSLIVVANALRLNRVRH
jgi:Cu2+-exporting ATPase